MVATYSCNVLGTVCTAVTAAQRSLFMSLQRELNRVRSSVGLVPDVAIDGAIGSSTVAKLIKTVDKLSSTGAFNTRDSAGDVSYNAKMDSALRANLTVKNVAGNALNVYQALQRNGYSELYYSVYDSSHNPNPGGSVPGVTINPYTTTVSVNPGIKINPVVVSVLPVGPTAGNTGIVPGGTVPGGYAPSFELPTAAKVGLGILGAGVLAVAGIAIVKAVRG